MKALALRLGGMLASPRATLRAVAHDARADVTEIVALFVFARLLVMTPFVARAVWLAGEAPGASFRRVTDALWMSVRTDVAVLLSAAGVLFVLLRVLARAEPSRALGVRAALAVTAYAGVPLVALQLLGATSSFIGFDAWWLPHHSLGSVQALVVDGRISMARLAIKAAIAYALPLACLLAFLVDRLRAPRAPIDDGEVAARRAPRVGAIGLATLTVVLAGFSAHHVVENRSALRPLLPGDPVPSFSLPRLLLPDGKLSRERVTLEQHRGKVVVLDFWASWCAPCRATMPALDRLHDALSAQGLVVIGINREPEDPRAAANALKELSVKFPSVVDGRQPNGRVYGDMLGVASLPTSFIIDREGVLRHLHVGTVSEDVVRREVQALLDAPP